jgi:hypothetical protein
MDLKDANLSHRYSRPRKKGLRTWIHSEGIPLESDSIIALEQ